MDDGSGIDNLESADNLDHPDPAGVVTRADLSAKHYIVQDYASARQYITGGGGGATECPGFDTGYDVDVVAAGAQVARETFKRSSKDVSRWTLSRWTYSRWRTSSNESEDSLPRLRKSTADIESLFPKQAV